MTTSAFIDDPTGTTHSPNGIQRPHFNDRNEHHEKQRATRTKSRCRSGHPAGHSSTPQTMEIVKSRAEQDEIHP